MNERLEKDIETGQFIREKIESTKKLSLSAIKKAKDIHEEREALEEEVVDISEVLCSIKLKEEEEEEEELDEEGYRKIRFPDVDGTK